MKKKVNNKKSVLEENLEKGIEIINKHKVFYWTGLGHVHREYHMGKNAIAYAKYHEVHANANYYLEPQEWAYVLVHCVLHMVFGHFDEDKLPGYEIVNADGTKTWKPSFDEKFWMAACNLYNAKFLHDMKFGKPVYKIDFSCIPCDLSDEKKVYEYLLSLGEIPEQLMCDMGNPEMVGLDHPIEYDEGETNWVSDKFIDGITWAAKEMVRVSSGDESLESWRVGSPENEAKNWFLTNFPLLGSMAAPFKIVMDRKLCQIEEIHVAAINVCKGEIYINPTARLSPEENRFVIAHELLHAGLQHAERRQGRDPYLWNIACDFVINGWLNEMQVGEMPAGCLYDVLYKEWSAESIYEELVKELRKNRKLDTFRGYGKGDIIDDEGEKKCSIYCGMTLDEFCKSALAQGLEYHVSHNRGYVPAGLVEEIRALSMQPIPWEVELARWLDCYISPIEKHRSYTKPSRRQSSTPDIPRPSYIKQNFDNESRTLGVIIDTSGSMSTKMIGMALGSIASYAAEREVPLVRVIFCDAKAYDAGYMSPEDIAGRVEVKGRGGTELQPAVDYLENANDYPKDGPILIITDGEIEDKMKIHHNHAFLIPKGKRLPFVSKGKVFYFEEK